MGGPGDYTSTSASKTVAALDRVQNANKSQKGNKTTPLVPPEVNELISNKLDRQVVVGELSKRRLTSNSKRLHLLQIIVEGERSRRGSTSMKYLGSQEAGT